MKATLESIQRAQTARKRKLLDPYTPGLKFPKFEAGMKTSRYIELFHAMRNPLVGAPVPYDLSLYNRRAPAYIGPEVIEGIEA